MIDWRALAADSVWILGLAILLGQASYSAWLEGASARPPSVGWSRLVFAAGGFLAAGGWTLSHAHRWWEIAGGLALAAWFGADLVMRIRTALRSSGNHD